MAYTTINKSSDYFNTKLYTGDGSSSRSITGVNFQPDWTWVKSRNSADYDHMVTDVVRGTPKILKTNSIAAEDASPGAGGIGSFDSDGFTIAAGSINNTNMNNNGTTYVGWNWLANGTGSTNTVGDLTSTVSVNTTSGFSIVSYTGNGTPSTTIGHGLGVKPAMMIVKKLNGSFNWGIYHKNIGATKLLAFTTGTPDEDTSYWNDVEPTSSVFYVGNGGLTNGSGSTMIAYCFAEKQGYSKFGSYTGNGSADGTFVYTGFSPAFIMVKNTDAASDWTIFDNKRSTSGGNNVIDKALYPNGNWAEGTGTAVDFTSNGFKWRVNSSAYNGSGSSYIYMAFAEAPLVGTNNVPANAR